jgi:hypothetical protein
MIEIFFCRPIESFVSEFGLSQTTDFFTGKGELMIGS